MVLRKQIFKTAQADFPEGISNEFRFEFHRKREHRLYTLSSDK